MRHIVRNIVIILLVVLPFYNVLGQGSSNPNIVIIMADDLGYGDFSCYGASKVTTPHVDSLAAKGIRFTNTYTASSLCSPSRYSLMTGRYSWRTSLKSGVLTWFAQPLIEQGRITIASLLKNNGYNTACIGKWHLGFDWPLKDTVIDDPQKTVYDSWALSAQDYIDFSKPIDQGPIARGFDYFFGIAGSNNMIPFTYIENNHVTSPPVLKKSYVYDFDQNSRKSPEWSLQWMDVILTTKAVEVIDDHFALESNKPLFLYFPTSAIHRPCLPTFTNGKSGAGLRGDKILEFDWIVGEVVKALKRNNVFNNTLLVITSDNGGVPGDPLKSVRKYKKDFGSVYYRPYFDDYRPRYRNPRGRIATRKGWLTYDHKSSGSYRGFKADAWDGGFRVPLVISWPDKITSKGIDDRIICNTDFLKTFSELIGKPLGSHEGEDSHSFLSAIWNRGGNRTIDPDRMSMVLSAGRSGAYVVRKGKWKYIEGGDKKSGWGQTLYKNGPSPEDNQLYDLNNDPYERNNVYKKFPKEVKMLKNLLKKVQTNEYSETKI